MLSIQTLASIINLQKKGTKPNKKQNKTRNVCRQEQKSNLIQVCEWVRVSVSVCSIVRPKKGHSFVFHASPSFNPFHSCHAIAFSLSSCSYVE